MSNIHQVDIDTFRARLAQAGIGVTISELEYLYSLAIYCSGHGLALGAAFGVLAASKGIPAAVAGALVGFLLGTSACMVVTSRIRPEIDRLLELRPQID